MSHIELVGFAMLSLVGLILSGVFSGIETGIYTLNRVRLAVRVARADGAALRLRRELDRPGRALSTILIGTNASSYLASFGLAETLRHGFGVEGDWALVAVEAILFTPLLFIFAETLPKDLFRTYTDRWTYSLSGLLVASRWVFISCGLLPLVHLGATLAGRLIGAGPEPAVTARQRISLLIKEGAGVGLLSESQTSLADRALAMGDRTVATEMVPWDRVVTIDLGADHLARTTCMRQSKGGFTRYPVVDKTGRAVGVLSVLDAVLEPTQSTARLMTEPITFHPRTPVTVALRSLRSARQPMAIAVDETDNRPLGLVTLKDLVEPLTGELGAW